MASNIIVGGAVWTAKTRICPLDPTGNLIAGSSLYVTDTLVKCSMVPVNESGDAIAIKRADGNLGVWAIHGDIPKWYTVMIELVTPDNALEALLTGGVALNDVSAALGLVTGLTVTGQTTLGTLAAGTYDYSVAQYNQYGETVNSANVAVTNSGSTSKNVLTGMVLAAGAIGYVFYGRTPSGQQKLGTMVDIGAQTTTSTSGTAPTSLAVSTGVTKPIPKGYTFTITGDSNTPKIVFTTTAAVSVGAVAIPVSTDSTPITTIAGGLLIPAFVDTGAIVPSGVPNVSDMTAGPGNAVGYEAPALGSVGNPNGCSVELFMENIKNGAQATDYPYWRIVIPRAFGFVVGARDATNANMASVYTGIAVQNPNFGSGPAGDWQFDSSRVVERAVCGSNIVPAASAQPVSVAF